MGSIEIETRVMRGLSRLRGLIGRDEPAQGTGFLFRSRQVHTFGVRYPIDAVYMDGSGVVLRTVQLMPNRIGPLVLRARWVMELKSNEADRFGITKGSQLDIRETQDR